MGVLVGREAPKFKAKAIVKRTIIENFSLDDFEGKNIVLFFYPLNFTFVCPTELHLFQEKIEEFRKRETEVVGCSVDSCYSHLAWLNTPREEGGIQGIDYPLISDLNKGISKQYDVLVPHEEISYRGLFLIDKKRVVRHQVVNDLPLGRSVEEALRMLDALLHFEKYGEVCPADWKSGKKGFSPTLEGTKDYLANCFSS